MDNGMGHGMRLKSISCPFQLLCPIWRGQLLHIYYLIQFESLLGSRGKPLVSAVVRRDHLLFEISEER